MTNSKIAQKYSEGNTKPLSQKSRNWCFTDFNADKPTFDEDKMKYLCFGLETCPTTGKSHWQGFVCFKTQIVLKGVKKFMPQAHLEIIRGTLADNEKYCKKDGKWEEFGTRPNQGERVDLNELKDQILNGKRVSEIAQDDLKLYQMYGRSLNYIEDLAMRKVWRTEMTKGIWYVGKSGTGKSHIALENYSDETHFVVEVDDGGWWDGYAQQETVVINDFRGEISYNRLLQLVDKWPVRVKRRGREPMPFMSKTVIITSSLSPEQVYNRRDLEDDIEQLKRRFEIIYLDKKYEE